MFSELIGTETEAGTHTTDTFTTETHRQRGSLMLLPGVFHMIDCEAIATFTWMLVTFAIFWYRGVEKYSRAVSILVQMPPPLMP